MRHAQIRITFEDGEVVTLHNVGVTETTLDTETRYAEDRYCYRPVRIIESRHVDFSLRGTLYPDATGAIRSVQVPFQSPALEAEEIIDADCE